MKVLRSAVTLLLVAVLASLVLAQQKAKAQPETNKKTAHETPAPSNLEFEKIKQLAGRWEGKNPDGSPSETVFRLTSGGSAVLNVLDPNGDHEMVTMFHLDGASLMATHYCAAKNQPRFTAVPSNDPKVLTFKFKDVTNLAPGSGRMQGLVITFIDPDHHMQEWIWREADGKEVRSTFQFERKK